MKHIFVINPAAGKGKNLDTLTERIHNACRTRGVDYEIHVTTAPGDNETFVRHACETTDGELRFYACGGDGTIRDTVNGAAACGRASVAVFPIGTGNDFVRNFTNGENFLDPDAQLDGHTVTLDLLDYNGRLCANMINIGFDCEVVKTVSNIKRKFFVPGKLAFAFGVVGKLLKMPGTRAKILVDGVPQDRTSFLLCAIGNGSYCGGGYFATPRASLCDGILDLCMIRPVPRRTFVSLIGFYKAGTHLEKIKDKTIIDYRKCRTIDITFDTPTDVCVDGEIERMNELHLSVRRDALRLSLPRGTELAAAPAYV